MSAGRQDKAASYNFGADGGSLMSMSAMRRTLVACFVQYRTAK